MKSEKENESIHQQIQMLLPKLIEEVGHQQVEDLIYDIESSLNQIEYYIEHNESKQETMLCLFSYMINAIYSNSITFVELVFEKIENFYSDNFL